MQVFSPSTLPTLHLHFLLLSAAQSIWRSKNHIINTSQCFPHLVYIWAVLPGIRSYNYIFDQLQKSTSLTLLALTKQQTLNIILLIHEINIHLRCYDVTPLLITDYLFVVSFVTKLVLDIFNIHWSAITLNIVKVMWRTFIICVKLMC